MPSRIEHSSCVNSTNASAFGTPWAATVCADRAVRSAPVLWIRAIRNGNRLTSGVVWAVEGIRCEVRLDGLHELTSEVSPTPEVDMHESLVLADSTARRLASGAAQFAGDASCHADGVRPVRTRLTRAITRS